MSMTEMDTLHEMAEARCPILGHRQPEARAAEWALKEIERLRNRVERLRGLCKSASGWLLDADDVEHSEIVLDLVGDMEPPNAPLNRRERSESPS